MMMFWNLTDEADPVHLILALTVHLRNTPGVNSCYGVAVRAFLRGWGPSARAQAIH